MFNPLRVEVMNRFTAVEAHFRATRRFRGDLSAAARGLTFVHIYAAYEFTVVSLVQTAIDVIQSQQHEYCALNPSILALFLNPQVQALRDSGLKASWKKRVELLEMVFSDQTATAVNNVMPLDPHGFKQGHLRMIFRILGIRRMPARRRLHLFRIDEVVENRHAVAHGRERPEDVGRRYSRPAVRRTIRQMRSVCLLLIQAVEAHCNNPARICR